MDRVKEDADYFNLDYYKNDKYIECYIDVDYMSKCILLIIRDNKYGYKVHDKNVFISRKLFFKLMRVT